jgi:hypothetical protein
MGNPWEPKHHPTFSKIGHFFLDYRIQWFWVPRFENHPNIGNQNSFGNLEVFNFQEELYFFFVAGG